MNIDSNHLQAWHGKVSNSLANEGYYDMGEIAADFGDAVSKGLRMVANATGTSPDDWHFWDTVERFDPGYILAFERPGNKDTKAGEPAVAIFAVTNDDGFVVYPHSVRVANFSNDWDQEAGCDVAW